MNAAQEFTAPPCARRKPKYPRYRAEKMGDHFIVAERCVRGFSYVYRNTSIGKFPTREAARAAIDSLRGVSK